jgi:hypothetical protein
MRTMTRWPDEREYQEARQGLLQKHEQLQAQIRADREREERRRARLRRLTFGLLGR